MPETIYEFEVPYPHPTDSHLKIEIGACKLLARLMDSDLLMMGTYTHPTGDAQPRVVQNGNTMSLKQGTMTSAAGLRGYMRNIPTFDLNLGTANPYALTVSAGAYEGKYELGGLPLTALRLEQGAGSVRFDFSQPNPQVMEKLVVESGAAALRMDNLCNANFEEMIVNTGATNTVLDFDGNLQREAMVKIEGGMAALRIVVPPHIPAQLEYKTTLGSAKLDDNWAKRGNVYWTQAALDGRRPLLILTVSMSLGAVKVVTA